MTSFTLPFIVIVSITCTSPQFPCEELIKDLDTRNVAPSHNHPLGELTAAIRPATTHMEGEVVRPSAVLGEQDLEDLASIAAARTAVPAGKRRRDARRVR